MLEISETHASAATHEVPEDAAKAIGSNTAGPYELWELLDLLVKLVEFSEILRIIN